MDLDSAADPVEQFRRWYAEASSAGQPEPEAMSLATSTLDGRPSQRWVLLKGLDQRGFVFYTNERSRKGVELASNPFAALGFRWWVLERQVRVEGRVERVAEDEADRYFASRARGSQLGAWASEQSAVISDRGELEARVAALAERFGGVSVPRPPWWGGFLVVPEVMEFWQGRPDRLHERVRYRRAPSGWERGLLSP